jgi:hypothetical protein
MRKARVGLFPPLDLLDWGQERARAYLARAAEAVSITSAAETT